MSSDLPDPFVYPGTSILRNKFNIRNSDRLAYYEGAFTAWRSSQLDERPIVGSHDLTHLRAIHRHLFQDGAPVSYPPGPMAVVQAGKILDALKAERFLRGLSADDLAKHLAYYYSELDYCHVFREGNSRTLRGFTISIARDAGHDLSWQHVRNRQEELYLARDRAAFGMPSEDFPDPLAPLARIIRDGLQPRGTATA